MLSIQATETTIPLKKPWKLGNKKRHIHIFGIGFIDRRCNYTHTLHKYKKKDIFIYEHKSRTRSMMKNNWKPHKKKNLLPELQLKSRVIITIQNRLRRNEEINKLYQNLNQLKRF